MNSFMNRSRSPLARSPKFQSPLARQAERFLREDLGSSSDSSVDIEGSLSPSPRSYAKSLRRFEDIGSDSLSKTRETTARGERSVQSKRSTTASKLKSSVESKLDMSRSRSIGRRTTVRTNNTTHNHNSHKAQELTNPVSCRQEKYLLRTKITELEDLIETQGSKLRKLHDKVVGKKEEVQELTEELVETKRKSLAVDHLQDKVRFLEVNEEGLVQELHEQQRVAQIALERLQEIEHVWSVERKQSKLDYEEYYKRQLEDHQKLWESKMKKLEEENWQLADQIRELEKADDLERRRYEADVHKEIISLKARVREREEENEKLRDEVKEYKIKMTDIERSSSSEFKSLKRTIESLQQQNKQFADEKQEEAVIESRNKHKVSRKIQELQEELEQKESILRQRDNDDRIHLEKINKKVNGLQHELKRVREYQEKIERLEKSLAFKDNELDLTKQFYTKKLEENNIVQEEQRREWANLYDELVQEIRSLKGEIDNLGGDNQSLMSSLGLKSGRRF